MGKFSAASVKQLETAHPKLQQVFNRVVEIMDCTVLEGKRSEEQQRKNVEKKVSQTMDSKHVYPLGGPSLAVDVAPYPLKWPDRKSPDYIKEWASWCHLAGIVLGVAEMMGIKIRWGGDWNMNDILTDQKFDDLPHFELVEEH